MFTMHSYDANQDEKDLKGGSEPLGRDLDIGQVLSIQPTAEEERKVLWKLDLM
jgi:hypothetical protein